MSVRSPLLEGLNDIQAEAVLHTEGPVLIVAGAGSGKTRALTHRVAYLIRELRVSPGAILSITFTNKAAREMADRVEGLVGGRVAKGMWILTFHSTCARILRREHNHLGIPSSFTIYDDGDTERLIAGVLKDLDLDPKRFPPKAMAAAIGRAKDQVVDEDAYARSADNFYEETVARVYTEYERRKHAAGALDFDDLITETVQLFQLHPEVLEHYQERFRYILVDEYQDTNRAQYELVNLLAARYRNVCVVGDADQGVYSWRGATIKNILDFERDYPDAAVFLMEQNYRSTQNILGIANALIEHNVQRKPKSLWTEAGNGELAVRYRAEDEHDEAFFVADEIERLRQSEGFRYGDVAVFYRTNAQSRVIEDVLMRVGTPYRVFGGVRFYQRKEIKDVLGYLRLLLNPQDVISFRRVVNMPKRGIGDATVSAVESFARDEDISVIDAAPSRGRDRHARSAREGRGGRVRPGDGRAAVPPGRRRGPAADGGVRGAGVRLPGRARRGSHGRGAGSHREPAGARGGRRRDRGARARHGPGRVPGAGLARGRAGRVRRGRVRHHADDAAHREGPGVPGGVHGGDGGRDLPALPVDDRRGGARGGASPGLRGDHAGAAPPLPVSRVEPHPVRPDAVQPGVALPGRAPRTPAWS